MELTACDDSSMETVCSPCLDLSVIPVVELRGKKLEWRSIYQGSYHHGSSGMVSLYWREGGLFQVATCNFLIQKILPALDKKLTDDVEGDSLVCCSWLGQCSFLTNIMMWLISDGWTSVQSRPIVNALLTTPAGTMILKALDTSRYILRMLSSLLILLSL